MAIAPLLIGPVASLLDDVLKRVLPEKMSETDAANLQQQVTLELLKADWAGIEKEFTDRADARALANELKKYDAADRDLRAIVASAQPSQ